MSRSTLMPRTALAMLAGAAILAACSSDPTGPTAPSELDGLVGAAIMDSTGTTPPPPSNPDLGSGQVHGTVLAPSEPGAGNDSLQTAPRLAGVRITVYPVTRSSPLELGDPVATMTTGADGLFQTPVMPGGDYVVTFEPSAADASTYYGSWVHGQIHSGSSSYAWWVVLAKR